MKAKHINSLNSLITIALLLLTIMMSACSKSDNYKSPLIGKVINDIYFDNTANMYEIKFDGSPDLSGITVSSNQEWCKAIKDNNRILCGADENETYDQRTATITIKDNRIDKTIKFNVIQKFKEGLFVGIDSIWVPAESCKLSIDVNSNVTYNVVIPNIVSWIQQSAITKSLSNSVVSLSVSPNNSNYGRETYIYVCNEEKGLSHRILIHQDPIPYFEIKKTDYDLPYEKYYIVINMKTNLMFEVDYDDKYIYKVEKKSPKGGEYNLTFFFYKNYEHNERLIEIKIMRIKNWRAQEVLETIKIKQKPASSAE